jgi:hypothetical protein
MVIFSRDKLISKIRVIGWGPRRPPALSCLDLSGSATAGMRTRRFSSLIVRPAGHGQGREPARYFRAALYRASYAVFSWSRTAGGRFSPPTHLGRGIAQLEVYVLGRLRGFRIGLRIPAKPNADSEEKPNAFRDEPEQPSERSDAGISILQEVFGFVKRNLSGAQRRDDAASRERGAGKGEQPLSPPQRWRNRSGISASATT